MFDSADPRTILLTTAAGLGLFHTFVGVDHYLPFIALGRARDWSLKKVAAITALCGVGHVLGSILLGFLGIALSTAIGSLEWIEAIRGTFAAWALVGFGLVYMAWSIMRVLKKKRHAHVHAHADGSLHHHDHDHRREHAHGHGVPASFSFWGVFIVFVLGPCEPLIPLLMYPAFEHNWLLVGGVAGVFALTTITTMVGMAIFGVLGLRMVSLPSLERYANVLAGAAITFSGLAILFLGI
ncbi:MAG: nickel/cobalt exporter [Myxococcota bacterium]|jgi:nickel/cobalt exporter